MWIFHNFCNRINIIVFPEVRRETDLWFFCPFFARRALSCRPDGQTEGRQAERKWDRLLQVKKIIVSLQDHK